MKKQARIVLLENKKMAKMLCRILEDIGLKYTIFTNGGLSKSAYIVHYYCDLGTHNFVISLLEADAMLLDFYKTKL